MKGQGKYVLWPKPSSAGFHSRLPVQDWDVSWFYFPSDRKINMLSFVSDQNTTVLL